MRRIGLLLLVAALVGLASDGEDLAERAQTLQPMAAGPLHLLAPRLIRPEARLGDVPVLTAQGRAAATSLLTVAFGLIFCRLTWWAGLSFLTAVMAAWSAAALSASIGPVIPPDPLLLAGLVAYVFGLLDRQAAPGETGHGASHAAGRDDLLMPRLAASSSAAILTFDGEGVVRSANRAAEEMFGYSTHELAGMPFRKLLAGPERDLLRLPVRSKGTRCELSARRKMASASIWGPRSARWNSMMIGCGSPSCRTSAS
jgi:PAS domain-containing protein